MTKRAIHIELPEADNALFEQGMAETGMNRTNYLKFLLREHEGKIPSFLTEKELIEQFAEVNTLCKKILLLESLSDQDKQRLYVELGELKQLMRQKCEE